MIGCESLVFMSLLEFTLAQFLQRRNETKKGSPNTILKSKIKVRPNNGDETQDRRGRNHTRRISRVIGYQNETDETREGELLLFLLQW